MVINLSTQCLANDKCDKIENTLSCFINLPKKVDNSLYNIKEIKKTDKITIYNLEFRSQIWPIDSNNIWTHRMELYIPSNIKHSTALLYINGGKNKNEQGKAKLTTPAEGLDFKKIATSENIIVANLLDVPNQFLIIEGEAKKEDAILAYTFRKVIENPEKNKFLSGHLPMAKSAIIAMDIIQNFMPKKIDHFILSGASKRGWAAWLAAIADERVSALVPIVIDILNTADNIKHICSIYDKKCPHVMKDYENENVINKLHCDNGTKLLQIEDPYSYINNPLYTKRFEIPKYIINMASDDFFAPDSSKFYFLKLLGENYLRYIPNCPHYFKGNLISDSSNVYNDLSIAVQNFIHLHLNKIKMPKLEWELEGENIKISTSQIPAKITLWNSYNPNNRDFRCIKEYNFANMLVKKLQSFFSNSLCDQKYSSSDIDFKCLDGNCDITIDTSSTKIGHHANFVEVEYHISGRVFTLTTETAIYNNE